MNDLDLAAALRRDADLVGDPPADLLDRLRERRRRQHRRTTAVGCVLAFVVVVAGGIPALGAFAARSSDGATSAVDSTTAPASTTSTGVPTPVPPTASAPASTPTDPQATVTAAVSGPPCDLQLLATALPADSAERRFRIVDVEGPWCSGEWAAASYSETWVDEEGQEWPDGQAGLFRFDGTAWRLLDRSTSCDPAVQPPVVWRHACDVD